MIRESDTVELGERFDKLRERAGRIAARVRIWANKRLEALNIGKLFKTPPPGEDEPRYTWRLGATERHCSDCLRLNGQTHTASEWTRAGIRPQSPDLECGGWNCDCSLELTDTASEGFTFGL